MQGGGLLGGSWMSSWTAGWVAEPNNRRRSGGTGRRARVTVRRQTSGKALVWVSEPTDVGKSTGLGFRTHRRREKHWSGFQRPTANLCDSLHVSSPSRPSLQSGTIHRGGPLGSDDL